MDVKEIPTKKVFIDGAYNFKGMRLGVVTIYHDGNCSKYAMRMDFQVIKNIVEYEATIFSAMNSNKLRANSIILHSDLRFVVKQYMGTFEAKDNKMKRYVEQLKNQCSKFFNFELKQISRNENDYVDALATPVVVREANSNRIVSVTILVEATLEEVEKSVRNIGKVTSLWFTPTFNFINDGGLPKIIRK